MIKNLNQGLNESNIDENMRIETEADDSKNYTPHIQKIKAVSGLNIEVDNISNAAGNADNYQVRSVI